MKIAFFSLLFLVVGYLWGYQNAHNYISKECERLGGFFVGKKIYKCSQVKELE